MTQNQQIFQRAASTQYAAVEPEPYTRERTGAQSLLDSMHQLNDALLDMSLQHKQQVAEKRQADAQFTASENERYRQMRQAEDRQWLEQQQARNASLQQQ